MPITLYGSKQAVIQVVQSTFTGTQTISPSGLFANWTDVTNLSLNITPSSSTSKILLIAQINAQADADRIVFVRFTGGNSGNYVGDASSSRTRVSAFYTTPGTTSTGGVMAFNYLDSPATTSSITYKVQVAPNFSSGNIAINYNLLNDGNFGYIPRGACSLIAMEVIG